MIEEVIKYFRKFEWMHRRDFKDIIDSYGKTKTHVKGRNKKNNRNCKSKL